MKELSELVESCIFSANYAKVWEAYKLKVLPDDLALRADAENLSSSLVPTDLSLDSELFNCQFARTLQHLRALDLYSTPWEKLKVLGYLPDIMNAEAKQYLRSLNSDKAWTMSPDSFFAMTMLLVSRQYPENLLTNLRFIEDFSLTRLKAKGTSYSFNNLVAAIRSVQLMAKRDS